MDRQPGATVAPATAIQRGAKGAYAYVLNEDSTVSLRNVITGATHGDRTLITDGLKPGDKVVTQGVDRLRDGAKVEVIAPGAPAPDRPAGSEDGKKSRRAKAAGGAARASRSHEPVAHIHRAPGRDHAADGRGAAGGRGGLPAAAGVGAAAGGLSDDSGDHALSRRGPGGDDVSSDGAARNGSSGRCRASRRCIPISSGGSSVITLRFTLGLQPRFRGAERAGGDECGGEPAARRSAQSADL